MDVPKNFMPTDLPVKVTSLFARTERHTFSIAPVSLGEQKLIFVHVGEVINNHKPCESLHKPNFNLNFKFRIFQHGPFCSLAKPQGLHRIATYSYSHMAGDTPSIMGKVNLYILVVEFYFDPFYIALCNLKWLLKVC